MWVKASGEVYNRQGCQRAHDSYLSKVSQAAALGSFRMPPGFAGLADWEAVGSWRRSAHAPLFGLEVHPSSFSRVLLEQKSLREVVAAWVGGNTSQNWYTWMCSGGSVGAETRPREATRDRKVRKGGSYNQRVQNGDESKGQGEGHGRSQVVGGWGEWRGRGACVCVCGWGGGGGGGASFLT